MFCSISSVKLLVKIRPSTIGGRGPILAGGTGRFIKAFRYLLLISAVVSSLAVLLDCAF